MITDEMVAAAALPLVAGPLDVISDFVRVLHWDAYVKAVQLELQGKGPLDTHHIHS